MPLQAESLRDLRNLCFKKERRFYHTELGHNYRLTNLQAAIGLAQLERIEESVAKKRWMGAAYTERLKHIHGLQLPVEEPWAMNVYWMYGIVLEGAVGMDAVRICPPAGRAGCNDPALFPGHARAAGFSPHGLVS